MNNYLPIRCLQGEEGGIGEPGNTGPAGADGKPVSTKQFNIPNNFHQHKQLKLALLKVQLGDLHSKYTSKYVL